MLNFNSDDHIMDLKRFAMRIKLHKVGGGVVHHCALLQRALNHEGIKARVVKGVCIVPRTREICEHYWVRTEDDGLDLDIGYEVGCLYSPELMAIETVLLDSVPDGFPAPETDPENARMYELYMSDPRTFTHSIKNIRL